MIHNIPQHRRASAGFTLIELLVVISIVITLAAVSLKALPNNSAGRFNKATIETVGILEQARQYAVAQNTYVWVLFSPETSSTGTSLNMAVVASKDGLDPANGAASYDYGAAPSPSLDLISNVVNHSQLRLQSAGTFNSAKIPTLPSAASSNNSISEGAYKFSIQIPRQTSSVTFTRAIKFSPTGQASNGAGVIDLVEFGLQPEKGPNVPDTNNVAVVRINGLTGQSRVFRP